MFVFTGREPEESRGSGVCLVSSWTTSGPQSSQSPSSGPGPRPGRSPRRRDTRLGSRPPRQRRESPGLCWWLVRELRDILRSLAYPSGRWCSWTRTWPFAWEKYSVCTDPWTWWWRLGSGWALAEKKLSMRLDCSGQTILSEDIYLLGFLISTNQVEIIF